MNHSNVFVYKTSTPSYYKTPPFHPSEAYPEYQMKKLAQNKNFTYDSIRKLLFLTNLDIENWNTERWNPFKEIIIPGDSVLIKPNLVMHSSRDQDIITTHVSVIRPIIDYVIIALKGKGKITIGDAPLQKCNFEKLVKHNGLQKVVKFYKENDINIDLFDFRKEMLLTRKNSEVKSYKSLKIRNLKGDPQGYKIINLKQQSNLQQISCDNGYKKFRVTNYDPSLMKKVHNLHNHKYLISNSVLQANIIFNIPKLKAHRKAGITACLKNTIGINGHKDWLPHHRTGSCLEGGDEYLTPNTAKKILALLNELNDILIIRHNQLHTIAQSPINLLRSFFYYFSSLIDKQRYFEGSWYGNDTIWRTIGDLNQILLYANKSGKMTNEIQRKRFYICDGIISGESEGPLEPSPNYSGILLAGYDPLMIDLAIAELINFDYQKIPQIYELFNLYDRKISQYNPRDLKIISNYNKWNYKKINEIRDSITFQPTAGWKNHIEK